MFQTPFWALFVCCHLIISVALQIWMRKLGSDTEWLAETSHSEYMAKPTNAKPMLL